MDTDRSEKRNLAILLTSLGLGAAMTITGCSTGTKTTSEPAQPTAIAATQSSFFSAKDAAQALVDAVQNGDSNKARILFGSYYQELGTGNKEQDARNLSNFAGRTREGWQVVQTSPTSAKIVIGVRQREFPIPLVADNAGQWRFDTAAGIKVIRARRLERNENETMRVCQAYVAAQKEYIAQSHDDTGVLTYASRIKSTTGRKDGLYWPPEPDQAPSPMGPLIAAAEMEVTPTLLGAPTTRPAETFHGYQFRILTRQSANATGGALNYIAHGNMVGGFALIAWPAQYGQSGIHTFIINQNGTLYRKDLGMNTATVAISTTAFDPQGWEPISLPEENN